MPFGQILRSNDKRYDKLILGSEIEIGRRREKSKAKEVSKCSCNGALTKKASQS
jgi:hypothetical protein